MKRWLETAGIDEDKFNSNTCFAMAEVDALQNYMISFYRDTILKNRKLHNGMTYKAMYKQS